MQTFLVRRHGIAANANELDAALTRLRAFEDTPAATRAQWLHSYAVHESDGRLGLACVLRAEGIRSLQHHAVSTQLPADEILPIEQTLVERPFAPTRVHLVRRRGAWTGEAELACGMAAARRVADAQMATQVVWLRSYAVREHDGRLGSVCLYQAVDAAALAEHAVRAGMPAEPITPVIGRIVFRHPILSPPTAIDAASG